jgi:D-inositol-3-phosphate glycosyltransferase
MVSEHASPLAVLGGVDSGGQNVHVAALATELGRRGNEVVVYTRRDDADLPPKLTMAPGVVVRHVDSGPTQPISKDELLPYMAEFAKALAQEWATERPDVVHAHFWMSGQAALEAAHPLGIPVLQSFHALGVVKRRHQGVKDTSPPERLAVEAAIVERADRLIATCSDELFELVRLGADVQRVRVLPCGVDLDLFDPDGPADLRPPGRRRIVTVGRLVQRKGVDTAIAALAELCRADRSSPRALDAELLVAGGPDPSALDQDEEARRLKGLAGRLGVEDRVHLLGRVERAKVPHLLRSADVVVCVPWYEPFGMVAVEAMACGVPVVASAVGGLVETVVDGVTGLHVPPRDSERLAAALATLLADHRLRARLGDEGVRRARARYGWARVAANTFEVYAELVSSQQVQAGRVLS